MDRLTQKHLDYLLESLDHTDVTGFELLEVLDIRSRFWFYFLARISRITRLTSWGI